MATLTWYAGTMTPHADQTGDPAEPRRTHTRHPSPCATRRANWPAVGPHGNGKNRQAGAWCQPGPEGNARHAQTTPRE